MFRQLTVREGRSCSIGEETSWEHPKHKERISICLRRLVPERSRDDSLVVYSREGDLVFRLDPWKVTEVDFRNPCCIWLYRSVLNDMSSQLGLWLRFDRRQRFPTFRFGPSGMSVRWSYREWRYGIQSSGAYVDMSTPSGEGRLD